MRRFHNFVDSSLQLFVGSALAFLIVVTLTQIIARYIFDSAFSWVEEISVLVMIWAMWAGSCLALKSRDHIAVDALVQIFPEKLRLQLALVIDALGVALFVVIAATSHLTLDAMSDIEFMSVALPQNALYWSVPVGSIMMSYYFLRNIADDFRAIASWPQD